MISVISVTLYESGSSYLCIIQSRPETYYVKRAAVPSKVTLGTVHKVRTPQRGEGVNYGLYKKVQGGGGQKSIVRTHLGRVLLRSTYFMN